MQTAVLCLPVSTLLFVGSTSEGHGEPHRSPGAQVCERQIWQAAERHGVPAAILHSVGLTETGRAGQLHPYALNIEGKSAFPETRAASLRLFRAARQQGKRLIDLGCMQINYHYHGQEFASPADMLDPGKNVDYAARFLAELHDRHGYNWTMAVARYHAGPTNNAAHKRYVCRVIRNLVATGYGRWTEASSQFCER